MIDDAIAVHQAAFNQLEQALNPIPVTSVPMDYERYVRIEALTGINDDIYKNKESGTHAFTVNVFDSPDGGTKSLVWTQWALSRVKNALDNLRVGGSRLVAQEYQVMPVPTTTLGVYTAQGFIRYRVQIGA